MADYKTILEALADSELRQKRQSAVTNSRREKIKKLLVEATPKSQSTNKLLTEGGNGLIVPSRSGRSSLIKRTRAESSEFLFESYEDYVAYMISDDERPEFSTFVTKDEYKRATGRDYHERQSVLNEDSPWSSWFDAEEVIDAHKRRMYEENARKREDRWRDAQREREWEQTQRQRSEYHQEETHTPPTGGDTLYDRISRNKERLLKEFDLPNGSTLQDVKRAYREQMIKYHPDKVATQDENLQREYTRKAQELNEAYTKLVKQDFM